MTAWPSESIYDGNRLALPDETVNFRRGDGLEKAFTLANVLKHRNTSGKLEMECSGGKVILNTDAGKYTFDTLKKLEFRQVL